VKNAESGGEGSGRPISVQTRFERFPASIRGAFVMRGADGDPHAVQIESAHLTRLPVGPARPITFEDRMLSVSPVRDLFVPFEVPVLDLEPGWYELRSSVRVDAGKSWEFPSRAFSIPWPRSDVRRGVIQVGGELRAGGRSYLIERVELGVDRSVVTWRGQSSPRPTVKEVHVEAILLADGLPLDVLPRHAVARLLEPRDEGAHRTVSYPVPKSCRSLAVAMRLANGTRSDPVALSLR